MSTSPPAADAAAVIRSRATDARVPFQDGFLAGDLLDLAGLRLAGSRCPECGIALWGVRRRCENCSSDRVQAQVFPPLGTVHTYTVQRYAPPKPHALGEHWTPRPVAWVDVDDGPRVLAAVACDPQAMRIGLRVRLRCTVGWLDEQQREVVACHFEPAQDEPAEGAA